jgi:hypothetical protein
MYAPKLLPYTAEERWQMGFNHRIDRMADEALAEIKAMADKARDEFKPPVASVPYDYSMDGLRALLHQQYYPSAERLRQQQMAMQNVYPDGAYLYRGDPAPNPFISRLIGNPFGI